MHYVLVYMHYVLVYMHYVVVYMHYVVVYIHYVVVYIPVYLIVCDPSTMKEYTEVQFPRPVLCSAISNCHILNIHILYMNE